MLYFYAFLGMLDLVAIILVINEDIFYEIEEKFFKIFWILLIPLFGAIYAMIKLHRLHNYRDDEGDTLSHNDGTRTYEFFDSHGGIGGGE